MYVRKKTNVLNITAQQLYYNEKHSCKQIIEKNTSINEIKNKLKNEKNINIIHYVSLCLVHKHACACVTKRNTLLY